MTSDDEKWVLCDDGVTWMRCKILYTEHHLDEKGGVNRVYHLVVPVPSGPTFRINPVLLQDMQNYHSAIHRRGIASDRVLQSAKKWFDATGGDRAIAEHIQRFGDAYNTEAETRNLVEVGCSDHCNTEEEAELIGYFILRITPDGMMWEAHRPEIEHTETIPFDRRRRMSPKQVYSRQTNEPLMLDPRNNPVGTFVLIRPGNIDQYDDNGGHPVKFTLIVDEHRLERWILGPEDAIVWPPHKNWYNVAWNNRAWLLSLNESDWPTDTTVSIYVGHGKTTWRTGP